MVDLFGLFLSCFVLVWLGLICFGLVWFVEFVLLVGWMVGCWVVLFCFLAGDLLIVWLFDCLVVCLVGWLVGLLCFVLFCLVLFVASLQLDRWPGEKHV